MNERIKELADRVDKEFDNPGARYKAIEKFAELIVKECAELLETNGNNQHTITTVEPESHSKSTDWREGYEEAVQQYGGFLLKKNAKLIKKHFGVEE